MSETLAGGALSASRVKRHGRYGLIEDARVVSSIQNNKIIN